MTVRRCPRRPRVPRVVALAGFAVATVIGCGTDLHPGAAAVVNGTTFSQSRVDDLVQAVCSFTKIQREQTGGTEPTATLAQARTSLSSALISFELTDLAAAQLGVTVKDSAVANAAAGNPVPEELDEADAELLQGFFEDSARFQLQQTAIGAHLEDPSVTTAAVTDEADAARAQGYLRKFAANQEVTVSPAYGAWNGSFVARRSGSLSDPVSETAKRLTRQSAADLPPSQVCG